MSTRPQDQTLVAQALDASRGRDEAHDDEMLVRSWKQADEHATAAGRILERNPDVIRQLFELRRADFNYRPSFKFELDGLRFETEMEYENQANRFYLFLVLRRRRRGIFFRYERVPIHSLADVGDALA